VALVRTGTTSSAGLSEAVLYVPYLDERRLERRASRSAGCVRA
jgi:hypothetical protein